MKKKIFLFIIAAFIVFIPQVSAATITPVISCDETNIAKNGTISCTVSIDVTTISDGATVSDVKVTITPSNDNFSANKTTLAASTSLSAGDNQNIGNVILTANKVGTTEITFNSTATDEDGATPLTGESVTKELKVLDDNTKLKNITIDGVAIPGFSGTTKTYSINANKSSIIIGATGEDHVDVTSGGGEVALKCGANTQTIKTKAEDKTESAYTLNINRTCNSDTKLKGLTLSSGSLSPSFSGSVTSYKVEVETTVERISITPVKLESAQQVNEIIGANLKYGENTFSIKVTSETGDTRTYTIVVTRKDDRSKDNTLKALTVDPGKLTFESEKTEYKFKVLYEVSKINVKAETNNDKAKVEITGADALVVGENTITIKVKAENEEEKIYTIIVTRLAEGEVMGDNPLIENMTVDGYDLNFQEKTNDYTLKIKDEKELNILITMQEKGAEYSIRGNNDLKNGSIITIVTTSEDGTTATYKITIEKTSYLWVWILIAIVVILLIVLVVVLIIKNKKNKDENEIDIDEKKDTKKTEINKVKTTEVSDKELLDRINKQIKSTETPSNEELKGLGETKKIDPITPISIFPREETKPETYTSNNKFENLRNEPVKQTNADEQATKICSICGHRVPASTKVCPYCRRIWN